MRRSSGDRGVRIGTGRTSEPRVTKWRNEPAQSAQGVQRHLLIPREGWGAGRVGTPK